jgi:hypothetical protein
MEEKEEFEELLEQTSEDAEQYVASEKEVGEIIQQTEYHTEKTGVVIYEEREVINAPKHDEEKEEQEADYQYARDTLYDTLEVMKDGLSDLKQIAQKSQHPRAFEVFAQLSKNITDASKTLMDVHEKKKKVQEENPCSNNGPAPKTVNNNVFVGSTEELDKALVRTIENMAKEQDAES